MSCKYCNDCTNKVKSMHEENDKSYFSILNEYMEVVIKDKEIDAFKINYCPMCGERVNEWKLFE